MKIRDLFAAEDRSAIEKYCREHTQQAYLGDHTAIARVLGQFLMYVDTRDLSLAPHLLMNGFWEMWVTQAIVDYVRPGMRCIDVGANFGYYTLLLSELVGDKGVVVAYEPEMTLVKLMKRTLLVNGLGQAQVLPRAASDHRAFEKFYGVKGFGGSGSLKKFDGSDAVGELSGNKVAVSPIDEDLLQLENIDFVKIDVQGHELQVLKGMQRTIERSPKIAIAMEFTPSEHEAPIHALLWIQNLGLTIRAIGTDGQVRPITLEDAAKADTGDHRMLWLSKG